MDELPYDVRSRFRAGDVDALAAVYDRYHRAVWSVTMRALGADHLAQQAVHDTFMRAWQHSSSYDTSHPLGPWLLTIARRTVVGPLSPELRRGVQDGEHEAVEDPGLDEASLAWTIQEAMRHLTGDEREIVRLSFFEGLTPTAIAERLGLPLGTVASLSHRAHRRLAELLAPVEWPPASVPVAGQQPDAVTVTRALGRPAQGRAPNPLDAGGERR
jgi:RNA polymerase sigma-70 factor, ECF subfamily